MLKFVTLIAVTLLLASCASQSVDSSYILDPKSREGIVTGSISYAGRFSGYAVHYKNLSTGDTGRIQIGQSQALLPVSPKSDFSDPAVVGTVFALPLEPGDYEISRWTVGSGPANVSSTRPFSISFKVEPGKLVYLGSFQFTQTTGMGLTVTGATLAYKDESDRDLPIMRRKFPNLGTIQVASALAHGTNYLDVGGQSSVRFTPIFVPVVPR